MSAESKTTTTQALVKPTVSTAQPPGVAPSSTSASVETKSEDPFAGGHMPHDEYLDALLRSDEFKDLHFQGPSTSTALTSKTPTSIVVTSSTVSTTTQMVALTSHSTIKSSTTEIPKLGGNIDKPKPDTEKEDKKNDSIQKSSPSKPMLPSTAAMDIEQEVSKNVDGTSKDVIPTFSTQKEVGTKKDDDGDKQTGGPSTSSIGKDIPRVLKNDHSYFKSRDFKSQAEDNNDDKIKPDKKKEKKSLNTERSKLKVDIHRSNSNLSGVGLTPPPESEIAAFVPTEEEPPREESGDLSVSNVIIVPGTPPSCKTPVSKTFSGESAKESKQEEIECNNKTEEAPTRADSEINNVENNEKDSISESAVSEWSKEEKQKQDVDNKELKEAVVQQATDAKSGSDVEQSKNERFNIDYSYDIQSLPKSPIPPPVRNLAKFAKVPDPPILKPDTSTSGEKALSPEKDKKLETDAVVTDKVEEEKMDIDEQVLKADNKLEQSIVVSMPKVSDTPSLLTSTDSVSIMTTSLSATNTTTVTRCDADQEINQKLVDAQAVQVENKSQIDATKKDVHQKSRIN